MSYNCVESEQQDGEEQSDAEPEINVQQQEATDGQVQASVADDTEINNIHANSDPVNKASNVNCQKEEMEYEDRTQNLKRQHATDSDSDKSTSVRRTRLKPVPNLLSRKKADKKATKASEKPPS